MPTDTSEKGLEQLITDFLCDKEKGNCFVLRQNVNYNSKGCVDEELLFQFLANTQEKSVEKLQQIHGDAFRGKILYRINQQIKSLGIIHVLRKGITDNNIKLKLFYDKPVSSYNEEDKQFYESNVFSAMRQVHYSTTNNNSLDLVIFINGLPLITFEFKNELTKQNVKDAIHQYKQDRDPKEELFRLARCLVHFAVDTEQVWMCTYLRGPASTFLPFNKGYNDGEGNPPNKIGIKTDYLWKEILTKDSITNIIQNYVQKVEETNDKIFPDGRIKKVKEDKVIFPRFHQLDVVRELLADAKQNGAGKKYLIQHSAGSGKSNSIAWLAHQLVGLHDTSNKEVVFDSIVVVTDRIVLDKQIRDTIKQFEQVEGVVQPITEGSKQLKEALESGKKIIITTIQKFPRIVDEIGDLPGNRFAIIIDEAHSSQSGDTAGKLNETLYKDFEKVQVGDDEFIFVNKEDHDELTGEDLVVDIIKGRKLLKNASYFAFTATPKNKTLELFGVSFKEDDKTKHRAFHLYSMKQAIEEKFILDVLESYTTYQSYYSLLKKIEDDPQYDKKKAEKKLRIYVESHEHAIKQKSELMIEHFVEQVINKKKINGLAKAMVVTGSRKNAVNYKRAFDAYLREHYPYIKALVAFSGEKDGETEASMNGFSSNIITDKFKELPYKFLIVANKFQTGFDQPLLHTMYVDKKLGGVNAVQTLSRLNRTFPGKNDTFILDFVNTVDDVEKSFKPYYQSTILGDSTDPNKLFDLQDALDAFQVYTTDQVNEFAQKILSNTSVEELHAILDNAADNFRNNFAEEQQEDFRVKAKSYVRLYGFLAQIVPFVNPYLEKLFLFLKHLINKIRPAEQIDFAKGILENIDMESYRLQLESESSITLGPGDELQPISTDIRAQVGDPEIDYLSNILKSFNEKFGTSFSDEDKVRKMAEDLMADVKADEEFSSSVNHSDRQNARITFDKVLGEKFINHMNTNFELYQKYSDDPEFRNFFTNALFNLVMRDYPNRITS